MEKACFLLSVFFQRFKEIETENKQGKGVRFYKKFLPTEF